MTERAILAPGYARALAGYNRAHADVLDADVARLREPTPENHAEYLACLDARYQWQKVMREQRAVLWVRHG